jgi:ketosteroid isomerase-like protein
MTEQHPNVLRIMRGIQAFNENDIDTVKGIFSEDIVYRVPGRSPMAGEYRGIDEVGKLLQRARKLTGGTATIEPKVVLGDEKSVMVYGHATGKREGKRLDIDNAYLYQFDDDGKCIEARVIPADLYAYDKFWS